MKTTEPFTGSPSSKKGVEHFVLWMVFSVSESNSKQFSPPENWQFQGTGLLDQKSVHHLTHTFHTYENDIFKKKTSDDDAKVVSFYVQRMARWPFRILNDELLWAIRVGMVEHWPEKNMKKWVGWIMI